LAAGTPGSARAQRPPTIFAAASLNTVLEAFASTVAANLKPRIVTASSSTLARQLEQGAPADIFISADEAWMDYVAARKLIAVETRRTFARNTLVLVVPADQPHSLDITADRDWLKRLPAGRIATGDPDHVPLGRYARAAMTSLGSGPAFEARLARLDTPSATVAIVARGEAAAGIVYATDAKGAGSVRVAATIPTSAHPPIIYPMAMTAAPSKDAAAVFEQLAGPAMRALLERYKFQLP
jgi:molybdate transport system substrate-binding protein